MRKIGMIINRFAGSNSAAQAERFASACRDAGLFLPAGMIRETAAPGDAAFLAKNLIAAGAETIVVCGGDGTMNEALQSLAGTKVSMACLPAGTANVLARELRLPEDPRETARLVASGSTRKVSVGRATKPGWSRYFLLMAGIGLDAKMISMVRPGVKRLFGIGAYILAAAEILVSWDLTGFRLLTEGIENELTFAVIANAASYAAWFTIAPGASMSTPRFSICGFRTRSRINYLWLAFLSLFGSHVNRGTVIFRSSAIVTANGPVDVPVQLDGEIAGYLPMDFECLPDFLEVVC